MPAETECGIDTYRKSLLAADIAHLQGAVLAERQPGYRVLWNSATLSPIPGERDRYAERRLVGGTNGAQVPLHVVAVIPLAELRGVPEPAQQLESVTVNGRAADCMVLLEDSQIGEAIGLAQQRFPETNIVDSIDNQSPLLVVDAGVVGPGKELRIEYGLKPRTVRVNKIRKAQH